MNEKYMKIALREAKKALKIGEIPVGTVIIKNSKIIAKAYNTKEKNKDCTCHAEINAIRKACKKMNDWRLDDCIIYTTLEPCAMCMNTIAEARIKKIVFGASNNKKNSNNSINNQKIEIEKNILYNESYELLKQFFNNIRNK